MGTATLQCKKVKAHTLSTQYAVGVSAKSSTGTVELANIGGGDHYPLVQKGQTPPCSGYAVRSGYAVCISAKRSTGTMELANMGGGDHYPLVQKGQTPPMQWACSMQWVCSAQYVLVQKGHMGGGDCYPSVQKGQSPHSDVCSTQ